ncbi:MAG: type II toxin-antitoxin system VapC family toxin [Caulobacteraceae bacterium]
MAFVVDASVVASWLLPDETDATAATALRRLEAEDAVAPSLWWFEMRNLLLANERRGRLDAGLTNTILSRLKRLPIILDQSSEEVPLLDLARRYRLTAYDAAYLELAVRLRSPLATLDKALRRAARKEGVGLI